QDDEGTSIAMNQMGELFITGSFYGNVDFGDGGKPNTNTFSQAFLAKYSSNGEFRWVRRMAKLVAQTPSTSSAALSVALDTNGNPIVAGRYGGSIDFGGPTFFSTQSA